MREGGLPLQVGIVSFVSSRGCAVGECDLNLFNEKNNGKKYFEKFQMENTRYFQLI